MASGLLSAVQPVSATTPNLTQTPPIPAPIQPAPARAPAATPGNVASVAAPQTVTARTITAPETVSGQLNTLLQGDSTYLQSARNRGMETANQRGLINSSLAAGTAERSAIDAALPIAQQDATTNATAGQSAQSANQDLGLTGYKSLLDSAQQRENFGYTTAENDQNIRANTSLQNDRLKSQAILQTQAEGASLKQQTNQLTSQATLQTQAEGAALKQQTQQQQATANLQTTLKQMDITLDMNKLDAASRDALTSATSPIIQQVQSEIAQIQRTPDSTMSPEAKATAIAAQNEYLRANIQTISTLYGYKLDWPSQQTTNAAIAAAAPPAQAAAAPVTVPGYEQPANFNN